ncbi:SDR family oxidoreductase [Lutimaribacter marinistellae]|uniref:SDR family oxidoreductase n=1 Tax=Lutimaribacter marinistellae TaxID=1820329 RepID=A0ABV7TDI5_9RHOB
MTLENKHILIVGGAKGMGLATARMAAEAGAKVTITARTKPSLDTALSVLPDSVAGVKLDFTDAASVERLAAAVPALDHLVLSASSNVAWGPFADVDESGLRAAFDAKFWGYWRVIRALAPRIARDGSITLLTGAAARAAMVGTSGLAAVNGALEAMAKTLAVELAPLRVNTVSPGMTATEAYAGMPAEAREGMFAGAAAGLPVGRIGAPEDIAGAILMAAANPFLTGATLDVDGGAHLAR